MAAKAVKFVIKLLENCFKCCFSKTRPLNKVLLNKFFKQIKPQQPDTPKYINRWTLYVHVWTLWGNLRPLFPKPREYKVNNNYVVREFYIVPFLSICLYVSFTKICCYYFRSRNGHFDSGAVLNIGRVAKVWSSVIFEGFIEGTISYNFLIACDAISLAFGT